MTDRPDTGLRQRIHDLLNRDGEFVGCPDATTDAIMALIGDRAEGGQPPDNPWIAIARIVRRATENAAAIINGASSGTPAADDEEVRERYAAAVQAAHAEWLRPGSDAGQRPLPEYLADAVLAVRDAEMELLRADLAAADDDYHALATHNDKTCEAALERTTLVEQLAAATAKLARVRQMADAWERQLSDVIRTATAVEAIRTAIGEVA